MILNRLFRAATPENPNFDINSPEAWDTLLGGRGTSSGEKISRDKALTHAPWFRGINLVSNSVGRLHLEVFKNTPEGKVLDTTHPAWRLLRRKPNRFMTAFHFKKTLIAHALQEGNGYAYIFGASDGTPLELLLLDPCDTMPVRINGVLWYLTSINGEARKLRAEDVLHIRGLSFDGLTGYSVWDKARESLGLGLAARKFGAKFFANNARPNIAIEIPQRYDKPTAENIRKSWEGIQGGLENSHRIALLWAGQKLHPFSIDADKAQLIETRAFENKEIALFIGIPSHKLGDKDAASYNSLEQENQDYLDEGLDPWLTAIEEECWDKLLTEEQKLAESHEIVFKRKMLLRANRTDQANYLQKATGNRPWLTPDEARDEEDLPRLGGDAGLLRDPPGTGSGGDVATEPVGADEPADTPEAEPKPESDAVPKPMTKGKDAAKVGDVQATALNGAQMTSLQGLMLATANKELDGESIKKALKGSFPLWDDELINGIVDPLVNFQPPKPPEPTGEDQGKPPPANNAAQAAVRAVVEDAGRRMVRRLGHAARGAAKKPSAWDDWLATLEAEHRPVFVEALTPSALLVGAQPSGLADCLYVPLHKALHSFSDTCTPATLADQIDRYMTDMEACLPVALACQLLDKQSEDQP